MRPEEMLALVRKVRAAEDELAALEEMAKLLEAVRGETGAAFDRMRANASTERLKEPE